MPETTAVVYVGPFESVYLPQFDADVVRGEVVEVPAAEADRLLDQDVWAPGDTVVEPRPTYPEETPTEGPDVSKATKRELVALIDREGLDVDKSLKVDELRAAVALALTTDPAADAGTTPEV